MAAQAEGRDAFVEEASRGPGDERRSQSERALATLRHHILTGSLPPGEKLKIELLQRDFALSSSPLREALSRLVVEGLVVSEENRGFRAAPLSAADMRDITRMRVLLESDAIRDAIAHGDAAWEGRVVAAHYGFDKQDRLTSAGARAPDEAWTSHHKAFHMALVSGCTYPRLVASCGSLFDQSERYRRLSARVRTMARDAGDEHRALMNAVLERRADDAVRLLALHIEQTASNVMKVLRAVDPKATRDARDAKALSRAMPENTSPESRR